MVIFDFPKSEPIFFGTKNHTCGVSQLETCMARFYKKNAQVVYSLFYCPTCKKYIFKNRSGKKQQRKLDNLREYTLINAYTGEKIKSFGEKYGVIPNERRTAYPAKAKVEESPLSVQWAASHPFQGGGCTPK